MNLINKKVTYVSGDKTGRFLVLETDKNEKLVELDERIILRDKKAENFCVRPMVAFKLYLAGQMLPKGYKFKLFETYRSRDKQLALWDNEVARIRKENPDMTEKEVLKLANLGIANPYELGSGHQTGGAVDITICDSKGRELDMGTAYLTTDNPKTITSAKGLTFQQYKNRYLLKNTLAKVGLVNYPLEWWHFSFGEQEWGALTSQKKTYFAPLKKPLIITPQKRAELIKSHLKQTVLTRN